MTELIDVPVPVPHPEDRNPEPSATEVVRLVAGREISSKLRDKTFIISTGVLLLIVAVTAVLPIILSRGDDRPQFTIAVVGAPAATVGAAAREAGLAAARQADELKERLEAGDATQPGPAERATDSVVPPARLTVRPAADLAAAEKLLRSEDVDAALVPVSGAAGSLTLIGLTEVDEELSRLISLSVQSQNLTTALQGSGTSEAQARQLLTAPPLAERLLDPPPANADVSTLLGVGFALLFFMTSFSFGFAIAQSVVEEKQSRVVELLVAAIPVRLLLLGKVLGSTILAFGQVAVLLAVGLAGASAAGQSAAASLLLHSGGWFLAFFALGFTMVACLWAAAGALSARQEDLQATTVPLQLLVGVPFFASIYVADPGRWMTVLSYIPFSAPLTMPRRLMLGDAAWWEPVLAALGVAATGVVLVMIAARLYEGGLLRTSGRTSLRMAWSGNRTAADASTES